MIHRTNVYINNKWIKKEVCIWLYYWHEKKEKKRNKFSEVGRRRRCVRIFPRDYTFMK